MKKATIRKLITTGLALLFTAGAVFAVSPKKVYADLSDYSNTGSTEGDVLDSYGAEFPVEIKADVVKEEGAQPGQVISFEFKWGYNDIEFIQSQNTYSWDPDSLSYKVDDDGLGLINIGDTDCEIYVEFYNRSNLPLCFAAGYKKDDDFPLKGSLDNATETFAAPAADANIESLDLKNNETAGQGEADAIEHTFNISFDDDFSDGIEEGEDVTIGTFTLYVW